MSVLFGVVGGRSVVRKLVTHNIVAAVLGGIVRVVANELSHLLAFRVCGIRAWLEPPSVKAGPLVPKTCFEYHERSLGVRVGALAPVAVSRRAGVPDDGLALDHETESAGSCGGIPSVTCSCHFSTEILCDVYRLNIHRFVDVNTDSHVVPFLSEDVSAVAR